MYTKFGKMRSTAQLNEQAMLLKGVGDKAGLHILAHENGLSPLSVDRYMQGITPYLATAEDAALGKIKLDLYGLDINESVMICGMTEMLKYTVKNVPELQEAVIESEKSAVGCLYCMIEAIAQQPSKLELGTADVTPWGKLAAPDLSKKSIEEIVRTYYARDPKQSGDQQKPQFDTAEVQEDN